jgi:hypothetical protein
MALLLLSFWRKPPHRRQTMQTTTSPKSALLKTLPLLALAAAANTPAWAERIAPDRSVVGHAEDLHVSIDFPKSTTGDLYIAADVGGTLYFYSEQGWVKTPLPREYAQTYTGAKQINLGNASGITPGIYPIYQVILAPNAADVYDTRNWVGGLSSLGQTSFQVNLPTNISGDFNGDGWADDDANHDSYHDDDANHDGYHDDDLNHDGQHDDNSKHEGGGHD